MSNRNKKAISVSETVLYSDNMSLDEYLQIADKQNQNKELTIRDLIGDGDRHPLLTRLKKHKWLHRV